MCVDIRRHQPPSYGQKRESCRWSRSKRVARAVGWLLPTAALALMPKCPACFAAYFAATTGLGLSLATAAHFRSASIVACVVLLSATALMFADRLRQIRRA